ncbi:hypothetical protein [Lysinibacter cavernae]|uniref:Lipoprotein n=1 Tax=Lysinibacter cavernae TaxID=1640652 RepID=A0A7X5R2X8_9MICO|nr:hypothetical protein [Lysinibacter cavernae]NIH54422.1 hypothetical protein [Lysinibacter cavernae]
MGNKRVFIGSIALVAAFSLSGCASSPSNPPYPVKATSTASSETPTAKPTTTSSPSATPAAWTKYTSTDGRYTFEHPEAWTVNVSGDREGTSLSITDTASGSTVATFHAGLASGPASFGPGETGTITFLANTPLDLARYDIGDVSDGPVNVSYATFEKGGAIQASMGLTTDYSRSETENTGLVLFMKNQAVTPEIYFGEFATPVSNETTPVTSIIPTFATIDEAKAFMETQTYKDLERMFSSVTVVTG